MMRKCILAHPRVAPARVLLLKSDSSPCRNSYTLKLQYATWCLEAAQEKSIGPHALPLSLASLHPNTYHSF